MTRLLPGAAAIGAAITALVAGCGGDSSSTPVTVTPGATSFVASDAPIAAWADPVTLGFDGPAIGTYAGVRSFQRGTVDPITGTDLGQAAGLQIWEGNDGHLWEVDLTSSAAPVPAQMSTESAATVDPLCTSTGLAGGASTFDYNGVFFAANLAAPTDSTYVYRMAGPDGVCDTPDDVIHAVKTGMAASDAPITAAAMPQATVYNSDGSIQGFVAKSGAALVLEDPTLSNPVALGTFPADVLVADPLPNGLVTGFATGRLWDIDGNIVFVDYAGHTVSASLFAIPNWTPTNDHLVTAASPTTLYFAINTPATGQSAPNFTIYSMPADGSAAPIAIATEPGTANQLEVPVNGSNLVVGVVDTTYQIMSWPTGGGAATPLLVTTSLNGGRFTATSNDVYWTGWFETSTGGTTTRIDTTAGIVDMTGATVQAPLTDTLFMVGGMTDPFPAGDTTTVRMPFTTMFQVQGLTPVTVVLSSGSWTQDGISGGTLYSIDTSSNTALATLGTFPVSTATNLAPGTLRGLDGTVFLQATNVLATQDAGTRDLYLVNVTTANSLTRVTGDL
jgi:hypothetical protein